MSLSKVPVLGERAVNDAASDGDDDDIPSIDAECPIVSDTAQHLESVAPLEDLLEDLLGVECGSSQRTSVRTVALKVACASLCARTAGGVTVCGAGRSRWRRGV